MPSLHIFVKKEVLLTALKLMGTVNYKPGDLIRYLAPIHKLQELKMNITVSNIIEEDSFEVIVADDWEWKGILARNRRGHPMNDF